MSFIESYQLIYSSFSQLDQFFLNIALVCILLSIYFHFFRCKDKLSLIILLIGVFTFTLTFALHQKSFFPWDEQYHALVALNFSKNPLVPMLIDYKGLPHNHEQWMSSQIWLHKQPLSLWQIALSIKLFGASYFSVRLPSIVFHTLSTFLVYKLAVGGSNRNTAFVSAIFFGMSGYLIDFATGAHGMDHVDTAFTFYILLSGFLLHRYWSTPSIKSAIVLGVIVGFAVLTKWLVGLLFLGVWGVLLIIYERRNKKMWFHLILSFLIAFVIFLPWQLYCWYTFPREFLHEMSLNSKHYFQVVERHGGGALYYWNNLNLVNGMGDFFKYLLPIAVVYFGIFSILKKNTSGLIIFLGSLIAFIFFSSAATKLVGYINIIVGLLYIQFFSLFFELPERWDPIGEKMRSLKPFVIVTLIIGGLFFAYGPKRVVEKNAFADQTYFDMRKSALKQVSNALEKNGTDKTYLIKGFSENLLPEILFFHSQYKVYEYSDRYVSENTQIIDLSWVQSQ